jgi:hypothetical protein
MAVKRLPWTVFCTGILFLPATGQPLGKGAISGTVVEAEGGEAVRKAIVTLTLEGSSPARWATARTDSSGQFQFDGLPAGTYSLRATKAEQGTAVYGAKSVRELGDKITLAEGEIRGGITLRFLHAASISGRVFDSEGEPVADANVSLMKRGRNLGAPILVNYRNASVDDRGEYRFTNIDPGNYYIHVSPSGGLRFGPTPDKGQPFLVDQYYGGTRDSKDAAPVPVRGDDHLTGLDFRLSSEAAAEIHGQVLGVPAEPESEPQPTATSSTSITFVRNGTFASGGRAGGRGVQVSISRAEPGERSSMGTMTQGPEHRFEISGMAAGRYRVEATFQSGGKTYGASQIFDLHPGPGDIVLTLAPGVEIQGTLRVEGQAPPGAIHVGLRPAEMGARRNNLTAEVRADGHFSIAQVFPGEWQLILNGVPPGFLKSARLGDKDVRFTPFEIGSSNDAALNVVVSMHTAAVDGEIDAGPLDASRAGIVIARADQLHTFTRFYYSAEADAKGKFHLKGIAPGKYKIFALEKMEAESFKNPEAVDSLDDLGETIDLAEGATAEAHPKLIPMERAEKALQ